MKRHNKGSLNLTKRGLSKFPDKYFEEEQHLIVLCLGYNKLTEIPSKISSFCSLRELYLHCNQLTHLPDSFGDLNGLWELNLKENNFKELPPCILSLTSLRSIRICYNPISIIPDELIKNNPELKVLRYTDTNIFFTHLYGSSKDDFRPSIIVGDKIVTENGIIHSYNKPLLFPIPTEHQERVTQIYNEIYKHDENLCRNMIWTLMELFML